MGAALSMMADSYDVVIIGAGIVGLAVARSLEQMYPGIGLLVLEKEHAPGLHQTGHNSGVIHSGLYYRPGSLKARLCVDGRRRLLRVCDEEGIPVGRYGKIVVATDEDQLPALEELWKRGQANGLSGLERLDRGGIHEYEPHADGLAAIWVPEAAVTDFSLVAGSLAGRLEGDLETDAEVSRIERVSGGVRIWAGERSFRARGLINCAGLHADRVAELAGAPASMKIIPFRGEYYQLEGSAKSLVNGLIYPVPDPRFPFLGVHFTRKLDGSVEVGPNAVLALAREHYRGSPISLGDLWETLTYPGFWRIVARYWRTGSTELWHSLRASSYARLARSLVPELQTTDLEKAGAGVRAQAVDTDGQLLDDFEIVESENAVHVLNAPSPAATSSLAIGEHVAQTAARRIIR